MKKMGGWLSLLLILALSLAACSGTETPEDSGILGTDTVETETSGIPSSDAEGTQAAEDAAGSTVTEQPGADDTGAAVPDTGSSGAAATASPAAGDTGTGEGSGQSGGTGTPGGTQATAAVTTTVVVPDTGARMDPSRLSTLLDLDVRNQNGDVLADVDNMVIDLGVQQIQYVVVASGGFLGIGEKSIAVPWNALTLSPACTATGAGMGGNGSTGTTGDSGAAGAAETATTATTVPEGLTTATPVPGELTTVTAVPGDGTVSSLDNCYFVLVLDDEILRSAPTIDTTSLPDDASVTGWDAEFSEYWSSAGSSTGGTDTPSASNETGTMEGTGTTGGTATPDTTDGTGTPDATGGTGTTGGTGSTNDASLNRIVLAEDLLGYTVTDGQGTTFGQVSDAIVDLPTGRIQFIILSTGESLGVGERAIPVPLGSLQMGPGQTEFMLNMDAGMLSGAPNFDPNLMPNMSGEGWDLDLNNFWQNMGESGANGTASGTSTTGTPVP